ncbi:MAG: hypothetical protein J1E98_10590 [Lachnospiraceae bacterium]|nr:hypothetical protein [Lachnospiraceae bacterium]
MRRRQQTILIVLMLMILICTMSGCGNVNASQSGMDTLSFMKDGKIVQTIVDDFDPNYYDVDELSRMTQDKIDLCSDTEGDIVCESVEENDGVITVKIVYQNDEDYTDFNDRELFFGMVKEAASAGYSVKDMVLNDGESLNDEQFEQIKNNRCVIIQTGAEEELGVNVFDKILYSSPDVVESGKKDAIIQAGDADKLSCIVFK